MKINNSQSEWTNIESGIPQGSILGPMLINIFINDIFYFMDGVNITNYADDNTPYTSHTDVTVALKILEPNRNNIFKWFTENCLKANTDKSHLVVSKVNKGLSIKINNDTIDCSPEQKLLGVIIDNELKFETHVKNKCKKSNQKLNLLSRIAPYMNIGKLKMMSAFLNSQFEYCALLWMSHSRKLNKCINRIQEKACI